jgi:hypothetical protein
MVRQAIQGKAGLGEHFPPRGFVWLWLRLLMFLKKTCRTRNYFEELVGDLPSRWI